MVFKSIIGAIGMYASLLSFTAVGVPMYEVDVSGDITGVTGLLVGGTVWDMTLHDGSFDDIYNTYGASSVYDTLFARDATQALVTFTSMYLDTPTSFTGCADPNECVIATGTITYAPGGSLSIYGDRLRTGVAVDSLVVGDVATSGNADYITYATWEQASVPEPAILVLMSSGLIAFGVVRRKSRT